jgi:hypothetical protein
MLSVEASTDDKAQPSQGYDFDAPILLMNSLD